MEDQETIKRAIESPFFIGRIAGIELQTAYHLHTGSLHQIVKDKEELENNAGIHLKGGASLAMYCKKLVESYEHCTHIAEWDKSGDVFEKTGKSQEWIAEKTPHISKIDALSLEPYYFQDSWMPHIKGKRILVIHPFASTFEKQVPKLKEIFPNRSWFEDCSFEMIKPPMTMAGNHGNKDWQEHLAEFLPKLDDIEFDIALVAAGGYGMLISDYLFTERKKSVFYIGGALQIFFGVIGKRWFTNSTIMKLVNDSWTRPAMEERPQQYTKVEKGCYW